jgi:AcrR family transcriptional regulator
MVEQAGLPVGRGALAEPIVANSQRERILNAMAISCADKGYNATTIADITKGAGVSRATFYELFKDKEGCLYAAMELALADLTGRIAGAYSADAPWASNVRNAVAAVLGLLAEKPAFGRMALIEAPASGGPAADLYSSGKRVLQALLDSGRDDPIEEERLPSSASRAALAAAESLIAGQILSGHADRAPDLLPDIIYITTIPYIGREGALSQYQAAERARTAKSD